MQVHVLLYDPGTDSEGIHSIDVNGITMVLMFEGLDDAERYCGLLEAQDFPTPSIEKIERDQIEIFCDQEGYEARFVEEGFIPKTDEERLYLSPPGNNKDVNNWKDEIKTTSEQDNTLSTEEVQIDLIRKKLEKLL